jgi:predicted DNA-binding transcriptional regulator YafY
MYHPTTRVLAVLELLQAHPVLSGAALADRLEIDRRTVRRYIEILQDLGIPIAGERGRYGGYRLRPGFKLPPLMFTEDEALALTLGLIAARRLGLATTAPAIEGALAKVDRVLPVALRERVQAVQETLAFTPLRPAEPPASETVLVISAAAREQRQIRMHYRSWRGEESERTCNPYGVVHHAGRWYLVGWDHLRQAIRVFRMDRVSDAELRAETFVRPVEFDSVQYVLRSLASVPYTWAVEVVLETTLEDAQRRIPASLALLEQTEDGIVLRAQAARLDGMARMLVGLECPFVVRKPVELKAALRDLATEIARLAE